MKKHIAVASVLALVLCGAAMVAYAQGHGPDGTGHGWGGPSGGPGMGMMLHELNLTDAQKEKVKSIMKLNHATMKPLMLQMEQNRAKMLAATVNGKYDPLVITPLATEQASLQFQMIMNREAVQHQIYTQVLTADQQAKAEQLRTEHINKINEHIQKMANGTDTPPPPAE